MTRSRWFKPLVAISLSVLAGISTYAGTTAGAFRGWDRRYSDALFPSSALSPDIAIVAIDDRSLAGLGRWPWGRGLHAQLLNAIENAHPAVVGYDVQFSEPSDPAQDSSFAQAIQSGGNVILVEAARLGPPGPDGLFQVDSISPPIPEFAESAREEALSNVAQDPDGVVRSLPLVAEDNLRLIPSLPVALLQEKEGSSAITLRPHGIQLGSRLIPADPHRIVTLNFPTSPFPTYSAIDVLQGSVDASLLEGRVVLVGATAIGLGDLRLTPVEESLGEPGVQILADALNTILTSTYVSPSSKAGAVSAAAICALLAALAVLYLPVTAAVASTLLVGGGYVLYTFARFDRGHLEGIVYPVLTLFMSFVAALSIRYVTELRLRRQIATLFGQYVPSTVAQRLMEAGRLERVLEGDRLTVTVLFCDLRGFTPLSEKLQPSQVRDLVNVYYRQTSKLVLSHGGTLLQYVGDEVLAVFGAPIPRPDHAEAAYACARDFQEMGGSINLELAQKGLPSIQYGIGLNSGPVVAAHVGNEILRFYSVSGGAVNLGSRLCSAAKAGEILLSEDTVQLLPSKEGLDDVGVSFFKGVERGVRVYRWPS